MGNKYEGSGLIEYSVDSTDTWKTAGSPINLQTGFQRWLIPDSFHVGRFRMKVQNRLFISDRFTASSPSNLRVGFDCPDSVLLYWDKTQAHRYRLYNLGEKYLEAFTETI